MEPTIDDLCKDGRLLQHVTKKTYEMCMIAVKQYGWSIQYVDEQYRSEELCIEAVKQYGCILTTIKKRTPALCKAAVQNTDNAIAFVGDQTLELCLLAVKQDAFAISNVFHRENNRDYLSKSYPGYRLTDKEYETVCLEAVKQNGFALGNIDCRDRTYEMCLEAVQCYSSWGPVFQFVPFFTATVELCRMALKYDERSIRFIEPILRIKLAHSMITDISIAFRSMKLPSYVLLEIIDWTLYENTLKHYDKIKHVIKINERKS